MNKNDSYHVGQGGVSVVGSRLGIVSPPVRRPLTGSSPAALRYWQAEVSETRDFGAPVPGSGVAGCSWWDDTSACAAAVSEGCERYCGSLVPSGLLTASWAELTSAGVSAVDPASLALYSSDQLDDPGFPFSAFTRDLPVRWVEGKTMTAGVATSVPASLVYLSWLTGRSAHEPRTNLPVSAGIAASNSASDAAAAALGEVLERDALATAWITGTPMPRLVVPDWIAELVAGNGSGLDLRIHLVQNPDRLPVVFAVLVDHATGLLGTGCALRNTTTDSALKAVAEAAVSLTSVENLSRVDSPLLARLSGPAGPLKRWRSDRRYRSSYRGDWADVVDIACHLQLLVDPAFQADVLQRLDALGGATTTVADEAPRGIDARTIIGSGAVAVEVTTPDVAAGGRHVVRVVVPGRRSTTPAAFPQLGGLDPRHELCLLPVPHA